MKTAKKVIMTVLAIAITLTSLTINPVKAEAADIEYHYDLNWIKDEYTICKGYSFYLKDDDCGEVFFSNADYKISYSKKGIVKFKDSEFYGKKVGTTTVTLTVKTSDYKYGGKTLTKSFKVNVIAGKPKFKSLKSKYMVGLKETKKLDTSIVGADAYFTDDGYNTAHYQKVRYTSSNKKVATVNKYGILTAKRVGTTDIKVEAAIQCSSAIKYITKTIKVTVTQPDSVGTKYSAKGKKKITLRENGVTLLSKKSLDLRNYVAGYDRDLPLSDTVVSKTNKVCKEKYGKSQIRIKSMSGLKNRAVTYKSSNKGVATVDAYGRVTPKNAGIATITVTSKENKKVSAKYTVKVVDGTGWIAATAVTKIGLEYGALGSIVGSGVILTSSDENILKIACDDLYDDKGIIPVSCGTVTLTAKSLDGFTEYSWKCTVTEGNDFSVASWE